MSHHTESQGFAGVMENTLALGGRFLRQDYTGDPNNGPARKFIEHDTGGMRQFQTYS